MKLTYRRCGDYYLPNIGIPAEDMTTSILRKLVLDAIRHVSTFAIGNEEEFLNKVHAASQLRQEEAAKQAKRQLNKDRKRIAELDNIIKKLYESYAIGRITDERFDSLMAEYEAEQKELKEAVTAAEQNLAVFAEDSARADSFLELAKRYTDYSELTTQMLNEFIDKIIIHKPEKIDGDRVVEVDILFRFIGNFELPPHELTPEEAKREAQLHRHRVKSRERYQKIKAGEHAVGQLFQLTCKCCGKTFGAKTTAAMFCGRNCRTKFYRQEAAQKRSREIECGCCGKVFTTTRVDVKYCCDECRAEANRRNAAERRAASKEQGTA